MRKIYLAAVLVLPLAAWSCSSPSPDAAAQQTVFTLQATNTGLDAAILAYDKLPFCAPVPVQPCADKAVVLVLGKAEDSAQKALDAAEAVVRNPAAGLNVQTFIDAAVKAVDVVQTILESYNVKVK